MQLTKAAKNNFINCSPSWKKVLTAYFTFKVVRASSGNETLDIHANPQQTPWHVLHVLHTTSVCKRTYREACKPTRVHVSFEDTAEEQGASAKWPFYTWTSCRKSKGCTQWRMSSLSSNEWIIMVVSQEVHSSKWSEDSCLKKREKKNLGADSSSYFFCTTHRNPGIFFFFFL